MTYASPSHNSRMASSTAFSFGATARICMCVGNGVAPRNSWFVACMKCSAIRRRTNCMRAKIVTESTMGTGYIARALASRRL